MLGKPDLSGVDPSMVKWACGKKCEEDQDCTSYLLDAQDGCRLGTWRNWGPNTGDTIINEPFWVKKDAYLEITESGKGSILHEE